MMHLLNHFSDYICQLGNLLDVRSELPAKAMIDLKHAYRQLNCHEATFQNLLMKDPKKVFQYGELNKNITKKRRDEDMPPTTALTKRIMKHLWSEIKTLDDLAGWRAIPQGELQNRIGSLFQEICRLHRLRQSRSVYQSSQWCKIHSVQRTSNSGDVFSMQHASSLYGSLHSVLKVEKA